MDVGCSLWGFGGPTNRQNKKKTHQNCMLASKTRKKHEITSFGHDKIFFFKISLDEYSYDTPYLQDSSEKKMCLKILFAAPPVHVPVLFIHISIHK